MAYRVRLSQDPSGSSWKEAMFPAKALSVYVGKSLAGATDLGGPLSPARAASHGPSAVKGDLVLTSAMITSLSCGRALPLTGGAMALESLKPQPLGGTKESVFP